MSPCIFTIKKTIRRMETAISFSAFLLILSISSLNASPRHREIQNFEFIELSTEVFRVIIDETSGDLLVGARNFIHKLSGLELRHIDQVQTNLSPELCIPPTTNCSKGQINNDNQVLLIKYDNKPNIVLACGSAYYGLCLVFKSSNFSSAKFFGSPVDNINFIASKANTVAFFAPGPTMRNPEIRRPGPIQTSLYIASKYDTRPTELSGPILSSKIMSSSPKITFKYTYSSETSQTSLDFNIRFKYTFDVNYLYGFSYGGYSYFLLNQPASPDATEFETKLGRICQEDLTFFSYSEIPLNCEANNNIYNLATAGYLGEIGSSQINGFRLRKNETTALFIAFASAISGRGRTIDSSKGSVLCAFAMKELLKKFEEAADLCFEEAPRSKLLKVFHGESRKCTSFRGVENKFCGSGINSYIDGREHITGQLLHHFSNPHITSVITTIYDADSVAVVGTNEGDIIKLTTTGQILFTGGLPNSNGLDKRIKSNPVIDKANKYLYLASGNQVVKFPVGSCSIYTNCTSCLTTQDPLICGWCGSSCVRRKECNMKLEEECKPEIFDFSPRKGPLVGGTKVTITGEHFGSSDNGENTYINITVADSSCQIVDWESTSVTCITDPVTIPTSGPVNIYAMDVTQAKFTVDFKGDAKSKMDFSFLIPMIYNVTPEFGPIAGGTNLTITGENLDIGFDVLIKISDIVCKIMIKQEKKLICLTGEMPGQMMSNQSKNLVLKIDDETIIKENIYEYRSDPEFISMAPKATITRGGTDIVVKGKNLKNVANPRIVVTLRSIITGNEINLIEECLPSEDGNTMICKTPKLPKGTLPELTGKDQLVGFVSFLMDGVQEFINLPQKRPEKVKLIYFPNPKFSKFNGEGDPKSVNIEDKILEIEGENINTAYQINVSVGEYACKIKNQVQINRISCEVDAAELETDDTPQLVTVKVGSHEVQLGFVRFVPKPSEASVATILFSILAVILVLVCIIIFFLYTRRGAWLKKRSPSFEVTYTPPSQFQRQGSRNEYHGTHDNRDQNPSQPLLSPGCSGSQTHYHVDQETMDLLAAENILIARDYLTLGDILGKGNFGEVCKGDLQLPGKEVTIAVAVKKLQKTRGEYDIKSFLDEGLMMKDFKHHNVLTLIGVSFEFDGSPMVVIPFMAHGDLLSYIRDENISHTVKDLILFGVEIAEGMNYLSGLKFVHRDLAARNCMLDEDLTVKVADFGLSRDIYERDYYTSDNKKTKLPVRWMSPESLEKGTYNNKTDVWSFGVVLWELMTRGVTPYPEVDNWDIINYLKAGRRLPQPSYCPVLLYEIMLSCWDEDPDMRPNFEKLVKDVNGVIIKLEAKNKQHKVGLNVTYINYPHSEYYNQSKAEAEQNQ